ncbi:putative Ran binding protein 1 [Monocercomonoides exilis]|uniref:putative Ran binding protein 1 n=1 Tax=Monocercomonoides exilis TaxID=2049356 RepID=UPI0035598B50|nr:putative Ran binding protein 1 [Monocercomonoides exilis]|eukprot:MONOS_5410.1-p1 / transcript=MONOS_5410.1 / gene=MONOS_5410 / organism=Monocercomonoides_exilis_PA203 / gene_product=Ran binding protein 1 / transcript_product=Ran binding protein 1 / location=Mono_scaffold00157:1575-2427(+) / protein_length=205 / sequence_SO=supercontig / SO=protein_coding / is_pseudo=false
MSKVEETGVDETYSRQFEPVMVLPEVKMSTGEEGEDCLWKCRAKLLRLFKSESTTEWKERGVGDVKFLRKRGTENVRLIMRRQHTLKICLNHYIIPSLKLQANSGSDKAWVWAASDFDGEKMTDEIFCIRFNLVEEAQKFKELFERCAKQDKVGEIPVMQDDKKEEKKEEKPEEKAEEKKEEKAEEKKEEKTEEKKEEKTEEKKE